MSPHSPDEHLLKSARFLGPARTLLLAEDGEGTTAACYYACLHAALALLASAGIAAATHRGVRQLLGQHFVKHGPLPSRLARDYARLMAERDIADYDVSTLLGPEIGKDSVRLAMVVIGPILALTATRLACHPPALTEALSACEKLMAAMDPPQPTTP